MEKRFSLVRRKTKRNRSPTPIFCIKEKEINIY